MKRLLPVLFAIVMLLVSCKKKVNDPYPERNYNVKFQVTLSSPNDIDYEIFIGDRLQQSGGRIQSAYYYFTPGKGDVFKISVTYRDSISIRANYGDEVINADTAIAHAKPYAFDAKTVELTYTVK